MNNVNEISDSMLEQAIRMETILTDAATGRSREEEMYIHLRRKFLADKELKKLLPPFVLTHRNLGTFWPFIRDEVSTYGARRIFIGEAFTPLIDHLESGKTSPGDQFASELLQSFDADGVHTVWVKALDRRFADPAGAITVARTLLETVIKRILDDRGKEYKEDEDLPKIYAKAAETLNLAPSQHSEKPIKMILGGATNLVNGLGTLRNRLSDSHGRDGKIPAKPSARHAFLAVNVAGAVATFLVETHLERRNGSDEGDG